MATAHADSLLLEEFECSICIDEYCRPVTAGPCNHTFCKHCLQRYIETKAINGEFPCPLCRKPCKLPQNGIDGLTSNFSIANIIEKYNEVRKQYELNQLKWNNCSHCLDSNTNEGSLLACLQCHGISLCDECGLCHVNHSMTKSHQVFALCKLHGKPLSKYCLSCGRPICVVCFGKHSNILSNSEDHDVVDYVDLVNGNKAELGVKSQTAVTASRQLTKQKKELETLMRDREKTMVQVKTKTDSDFSTRDAKIDKSCAHHKERFKHFKLQMELMQQEIGKDAERKSRIQEIKERCLRKVDKDLRAEREDVTTMIQNVSDLQGQIEECVTRSDALVSQKLLKAELHDNIYETKTELQELTNAAAIDRVTPYRERMRPDYVLSEFFDAARQLSPALHVTDCGFLTSVTYMSRNRIAASVKKTNDTFEVVLWNLPDKTADVLLHDNVPLVGTASMGPEKLVVLRRASPVLKVIYVVTKATRDIDVDIPKEVICHLWGVVIDDRGHFMVTYDDLALRVHTLLISNDGQLIKDQIVKGYRPTYCNDCRLTDMVTLCTNMSDIISCYQVNDDSQTEVMSARHGVEGFACDDICSGSLGEMFIVGRMVGGISPLEIRLYQVLLDTDKKTVSVKQIAIIDLELRANEVSRCSINGNNLVIGYDDTVHVLELSI